MREQEEEPEPHPRDCDCDTCRNQSRDGVNGYWDAFGWHWYEDEP